MLKRIIASTVMAITTQATRAGRSQRARRVVPGDGVPILPFPRPCSLVLSVTTPLYSTTVSQALRHTLRTDTLEEYLPAQATHETTRTWGWHRGCGGGEYKSIHQLQYYGEYSSNTFSN